MEKIVRLTVEQQKYKLTGRQCKSQGLQTQFFNLFHQDIALLVVSRCFHQGDSNIQWDT